MGRWHAPVVEVCGDGFACVDGRPVLLREEWNPKVVALEWCAQQLG